MDLCSVLQPYGIVWVYGIMFRMQDTFWDDMYANTPLEKIPWQLTQADWLSELIASKTIAGTTALDLGCGTGIKTIQLAQSGFKRVVGVDIAPKAIDFARQNIAKLSSNLNVVFKEADITDPSSFDDLVYDFVLDWAALHCIPKAKRHKYADIITAHTRKDSQFLLRVFAKQFEKDEYFIDHAAHSSTRIYPCDDNEVNELFGDYFDITQTHHSKPRTKAGRVFNEYLMVRYK